MTNKPAVTFVSYQQYPPAFQLVENDPIKIIVSNLRTWVDECPTNLQVTRDSPEYNVWHSYWSKRLHDPHEPTQIQYLQNILFAVSKRIQRQGVTDIDYCNEVIGLTRWFTGDSRCDDYLSDLPVVPQVRSSSDPTKVEGGVCLRWIPDANRQSPLFYQAGSRGKKDIVKYYVETLLIPVDQQDTAMQTPIFYAARDGNLPVIRYLLTDGHANVNHMDSYKQSALFYAAKNLRKEAIQLMIDLGADALLRDVQKKTAANWTDDQSIKTLLQRRQRAQQLEQKSNESKKRVAPNGKGASNPSAKRKRFALTISCPDSIRWAPLHAMPIIYDPDSHEQLYPSAAELAAIAAAKNNPALAELTPYRTTQTIPLIPMLQELKELERQLPSIAVWSPDWPAWGTLPDDVEARIEQNMKDHEDQKINEGEEQKKDIENLCPKISAHLAISMTVYRGYWMNEFKKILQILMQADSNNWFSRPVDPIQDQCTDYNSVIKSPMDFGSIKKKLNDGKYAFISMVIKDIDLVFSNCFQYNRLETNPVYMKGKELESEWESRRHSQFIDTVWLRVELEIIRFILELREKEEYLKYFE